MLDDSEQLCARHVIKVQGAQALCSHENGEYHYQPPTITDPLTYIRSFPAPRPITWTVTPTTTAVDSNARYVGNDTDNYHHRGRCRLLMPTPTTTPTTTTPQDGPTSRSTLHCHNYHADARTTTITTTMTSITRLHPAPHSTALWASTDTRVQVTESYGTSMDFGGRVRGVMGRGT
ncbi:hypothetical protein Hypma_004548 [Hypsizygus marmoreus]|uniref:Uncharacterized protein n=1 Tax=Hypsizygus marmoreus TaxID=39966 RepID=A0A369J4R7_HYPMA|nr:hypothetical protein Hypma_004548 [Hypsizygus marmoreus]